MCDSNLTNMACLHNGSIIGTSFLEDSSCLMSEELTCSTDDVSQLTVEDGIISILRNSAPHLCLLLMVSLHLLKVLTPNNENGRNLGICSVVLLKVSTSMIMALVSILQALLNDELKLSMDFAGKENCSKLTQSTTFGVAAVMTLLENRQGIPRRSRMLMAFWTVMLVTFSTTMYINFIAGNYKIGKLENIIDAIQFVGVVVGFILSFVADESPKHMKTLTDPVVTTEKKHPEDEAGLWSKLTFGWTSSMVSISFKRDLEEQDIPELNPCDQCRNVVPVFEREWKREEFRCQLIDKSKDISTSVKEDAHNVYQKTSDKIATEDKSLLTKNNGDFKSTDKMTVKNEDDLDEESNGKEKKSIFRVLMKVYGLKFALLQLSITLLDMRPYIYPLFIAALMRHINNRENETERNGIFIVFTGISLYVFGDILAHKIWFAIHRVTKHMKISVRMMIFKKSMTLSNESRKGKTNGELVNIISDDVSRVFDTANIIFILMMAPLKVGIGFYLLYDYLGWSMLVSMAILPLLIPLNIFVGRKLTNLNKKRDEIKDKRVKLMNEIVTGIKVLKLYAWEDSFIDKVNSIRAEERNTLKDMCKYNAGVDSAFRAIPFLVKACSFGMFLLTGGHLDPTIAFTSINLFHNINHPFSLVALLMPRYVEALISLKRLTKFMNGEDISSDVVEKTSEGQSAISVKDGIFMWEKTNSKPTLTDINVNVPKGGLVAVVGMVGSGKSSLLSSMLGEMEKVQGQVQVQGRLAYVPQEAWILNATLKDNILFGSELDTQTYRNVVHNCCLKTDIKILSGGDKTEIGEKGINLSGGQKQRVSLARAVYQDADVYLLDDPLSAVDAHVGKDIFNKVISHKGMLKNKTRVLVTHGVHWLPFVDSVVVMKDGQVSESGTYVELLARNGTLAQFIREVSSSSLKESQQSNQNEMQDSSTKLTDGNDVTTYENAEEEDVDVTDESDGKLIDEEESEIGAVKKTVYLDYLKAVGFKSFVAFIFLFFVTLVAENCNMYIIKQWTDDPILTNSSSSDSMMQDAKSWSYFNVFVASGLVECFCAFLFILLTLKGGFNASFRIHNNLLNNIMRYPMSFFDTTPSSRIVSKFSTDTARIDGLSGCLRGYIERLVNLPVCLLIIMYSIPSIVIFLLPLVVVYYFLHRVNISALRQLRRFRDKHRSPVWGHYSESLNGVSSIRAYGCQNRFVETMEKKIETWIRFDMMEMGVSFWSGLRFAFLFFTVQFVTGIIVVFDSTMTAGMAGLVLSYAADLSHNLADIVRIMTHVETEMVSLEKVQNYSKKPTEAPWEITETKPSSNWPNTGGVVLENLKARYRDGLDLVLKGVSCEIKSGEKIGIVGRTGAGKSSLTVALFRLVEAAGGQITIDGEQTSKLGLHDLRSKLTILPQDPVIFAGTLRMNLDPFDKFTPDELWKALQHAHLKSFVEGLPNKLDHECGEGGKNFSVGQRQLICLARTLLRQTKILVLDEATAAVDMETDNLIQGTIRSEFKECTVFSIAHRLNTIMDYDRIMVLDQGIVKEFDSPANLLGDSQSTFYSMAKDANLV